MRAACLVLALLAPAAALAQPAPPLPPVAEEETAFGPRYVIEGIEVRGNRRTERWMILRELGLQSGDVIAGAGSWRDAARLRLLSLGYFLDVRFWLYKGVRRGGVVLLVDVEERGTFIINQLHLGTSEATALWGGVDLGETNFLGRGMGIGGGFVASTRPRVEGASPALAFSLRVAGPPPRSLYGLALASSFLYSDGSEFYRASGAPSDVAPADFVAVRTKRVGGGLSVGTDLSRATRAFAEGRFEAIDARLPDQRTQDLGNGTMRPIVFGIHEGSSRLGSVAVGFDVDTRNDPVLPSAGGRAALTLQTALPVLGSSYAFAKGVLQGSHYWPVGRHVLGLHGFAGAIFGDAPYFEQFFVGDLNLLLPPRALGINFSTLPSRDLLGTSIASHRYEHFAARTMVEYAIPLWRRHGFVYRGDAFAALGAFVLASEDDLRVRDQSVRHAIPADLTADLGVRLDTYVGIFTLSIANALGRIPF
jgi:outer membrane protein assembly factor BamA